MDQELTVNPTTGNVSVGTRINYNPQHLSDITTYLNVQTPTTQENDQLDFVYNVLKDNARDSGDMLLKARKIERKLGAPMSGETRLGRIYNYLKIQHQIDVSRKKLRALRDSRD